MRKGLSDEFRTPPHKVRRTNTAPEDPSHEKDANPAKRLKKTAPGNEIKAPTTEASKVVPNQVEPAHVTKNKEAQASEPAGKETTVKEIPKSTAAKSAPAPRKHLPQRQNLPQRQHLLQRQRLLQEWQRIS